MYLSTYVNIYVIITYVTIINSCTPVFTKTVNLFNYWLVHILLYGNKSLGSVACMYSYVLVATVHPKLIDILYTDKSCE